MISTSALKMIRMLGIPPLTATQQACIESRDNLDNAFRNRIAFFYLHALATQGHLDQFLPEYQRHLRRHNNLHTDIRTLTHELEATGIEYVFLKTLRYYPENPNDIDLIVLGDEEQNRQAIQALERLGYKQYIVTLGGITGFRDPRRPRDDPQGGDKANYFDLDLYHDVTVHDLVFFDKNHFRGAGQLRTFNNVVDKTPTTARVLPPWLDLFFVYLHSIFPNRSYGLEIFYTTLYALQDCSQQDLQTLIWFGRSLHLGGEMGYAFHITQCLLKQALNQFNEKLDALVSGLYGSGTNHAAEMDFIEFPYVYPRRFFLWTGIKAALTHRKGIRSAGKVLVRMLSPRYTLELLHDTFSTRMAVERYKLKY